MRRREKKRRKISSGEREHKKMMSNEESGGRNLLQYVSCLHHFFPYLQLSLSLLFLPFHANGEKKACTAIWRKRSTSFCALNGALMLWSTYKRTLRKISIFLLFTVNNLKSRNSFELLNYFIAFLPLSCRGQGMADAVYILSF